MQAPFDSGLSRGIPYSQRTAAGCRSTFALATAAGGRFDDPRAAPLSSLLVKLAFLRPAFGGIRTRDSRVISTVLYLSELQNGGIQESNLAGWLLHQRGPVTRKPLLVSEHLQRMALPVLHAACQLLRHRNECLKSLNSLNIVKLNAMQVFAANIHIYHK